MSRAGDRLHGLEKLEVEVYYQDHLKHHEDGKEERNPANGEAKGGDADNRDDGTHESGPLSVNDG